MDLDLKKLEAVAAAATPGPWAWRHRYGRIDLAAPHGGGTVVMDFCRFGMQGAQPRFAICPDGNPRGKRGGVLLSAAELIERDAEKLLRHPDADYIAEFSPAVVKELLRRIKDLERLAETEHQIQRACGELPEGWEIRLYMENGAGWVDLHGPDGEKVEAGDNDGPMASRIAQAIEVAKGAPE